MDEMKIESKFMTKLASKIAGRMIRNKLGYDMDIQLNGLRTVVLDDKMHVHLDLDVELSKEELSAILKSIGI